MKICTGHSGGVFGLLIISSKNLAVELNFYSAAKRNMLSFNFLMTGIDLILILGGAAIVLGCVGLYEHLCQKVRKLARGYFTVMSMFRI